MLKYLRYAFFLFFLIPAESWGQFPPLEFSISHENSATTGTVDVDLLAGTNWQNITRFETTFSFDTTVISWNSMSYWGLSHPAGATFTDMGNGLVTFTWQSLITVGPTLSTGTKVFTMRFNVEGSAGQMTPVTIVNSPQPPFWYNGFGWSGNNFQFGAGSVTIGCAAPVGSFIPSGNTLTYTFTNTTTGGLDYLWDFGDGDTSTFPSPSHTFAAPGNYTVCMIASSPCGSDTTCQTINVCPLIPMSNYSFVANQLAVNFTDASINNPNNWLWDFGDGNASTAISPVHNYSAPGTYTACLVASNGCGADTSCQTFTISCPAPMAAWTDSSSSALVYFTDASTGTPTNWLWDFGDGDTSSMQNPVHTYSSTGLYNVCLISTSVCGSDTSCRNVNVAITGIADPDSELIIIYPNPATDRVYIDLPVNTETKISLINLQGKLVYKKITDTRLLIDTKNISRGTYFIFVEQDNLRYIKKLILN